MSSMRTIRGIIKWLAIGLMIIVIGIQFIRPARTNPPVDESQTIAAHTQMTPQVGSILDRSCRDCHSNKTIWPWYTNVAPISWWLSNHVNEGRRDLNMSEWGRLPRDRQERKLRQICDQIEDGQMPLSTYLPMHPAARLSEPDKKTLYVLTGRRNRLLARRR